MPVGEMQGRKLKDGLTPQDIGKVELLVEQTSRKLAEIATLQLAICEILYEPVPEPAPKPE